VLLIDCVMLGVSLRAAPIPTYSVIDLGSSTSGAGYVTDSTGTRYPFDHTSVDYVHSHGTPPDPTLSALPAFPKGSQVYPIAQNSQGLILGYFSLDPVHLDVPGIFDTRTSSFVAKNMWPIVEGVEAHTPLGWYADMNSTGWSVGTRTTDYYQVLDGKTLLGLTRSGVGYYQMQYGFLNDPLTSKNYSLDSLLAPNSGWHISTADKIDNQGRILATGYQGGTIYDNGAPPQPTHALLLIPQEPLPVPEPSTLALFGVAALAWAGRTGCRWRRGASGSREPSHEAE
jgi:hypothetical protein